MNEKKEFQQIDYIPDIILNAFDRQNHIINIMRYDMLILAFEKGKCLANF